jgi:hypothetical protein
LLTLSVPLLSFSVFEFASSMFVIAY